MACMFYFARCMNIIFNSPFFITYYYCLMKYTWIQLDGQTSELVSQSMSMMRRFLSSTRSITRVMMSLTGSRWSLPISGRMSSDVCSGWRFTLQAWRSAPIRNRSKRRRVSRSRGPSSPSLQSGGLTKWRSVTSNLSPIPPSLSSQSFTLEKNW